MKYGRNLSLLVKILSQNHTLHNLHLELHILIYLASHFKNTLLCMVHFLHKDMILCNAFSDSNIIFL